MKSFSTSKDTIERVKKQSTESQTIYVNPISDKGLVFRM